MTDSKLLDSSIWLSYLTNKEFTELIELKEALYTSSLTLFEIKKKLLKEKTASNIINQSIAFIKQRSLILPLTKEIAENAADISYNSKLPAIDAMIYASAQMNKLTLFTRDNDFRGLPNVIILD